MSEIPDLTERWCPGCEPDRDPFHGIILTVWCRLHAPSLEGLDDKALAPSVVPLASMTEADSRECRRMAELLRRPRP